MTSDQSSVTSSTVSFGDGGLSAAHPFPGLRPFGFEDRAFFFGREQHVYALYRLLDLSRFVAVIGSSGSGKSSLVRAGLLPLLAEESQSVGSRKWRTAIMTPGNSPIGRLADALCSLGPEDDSESDRRIRKERIELLLRRSSFGLTEALAELPGVSGQALLVVVDQFEELFRYASTATPGDRALNARWRDEAVSFVQLLLEATRGRSRGVNVLITMRSDFIGDCAQFHELPEAVSAAQFLTPSLTRDQREEVIRCPLEASRSTIEPALVERILNDVGQDSDQLPVLQHCLARLWDRASLERDDGGRNLEMRHYIAIGEMSGSLSQHANEVLNSLPGLELDVAQVFRALSEVDRDGRATRRALPYERLLAETGIADADLRRVLDRFRATDCSFLVPSLAAIPVLGSDTRIDVVHEALLRRWDRISSHGDPNVIAKNGEIGWLAAEEADGHIYRALVALIDTGGENAHPTLPLDQVESRLRWWQSRPRTAAWAERYGGQFARVQQLFIDSQEQLVETKRQAASAAAARSQARRQRFVLSIVIPFLLLAVGCAAVAGWQYFRANAALADVRKAEEQQRIAMSDAAASQRALAQLKMNQAMRLVSAEQLRANQQAENALKQSQLAAEAKKEAAKARLAETEARGETSKALAAEAEARHERGEAEVQRVRVAELSAAAAKKRELYARSDEEYAEGFVELRMAEYQKAIDDFTQALALDGGEKFSFAARGYAYDMIGSYDNAIADEQRSLQYDSNFANALSPLAVAYFSKGENTDALRALDRLVHVAPRQSNAYVMRSQVLVKIHRFPSALSDLNTAITLNPNPEAYVRRGEAKQLLGDSAGASADFAMALKLKPSYGPANLSFMILDFANSDYSDAKENWQNAVRSTPPDIYAVLWLQLLNWETGGGIEPSFSNLAHADESSWPHAIARLFLGTESVDEVLTEATAMNGPDEGPTCVADFYAGEYLLFHAQTIRGRDLIERAAEHCPPTYPEYRAAIAERRRLPQ